MARISTIQIQTMVVGYRRGRKPTGDESPKRFASASSPLAGLFF
jgi:hypothetical protein